MASKRGSKAFDAAKIIYDALEPLDNIERERILSSVCLLLGIPSRLTTTSSGSAPTTALPSPSSGSSTRPIGLTELISQKNPKTNPHFITLFAYFREKYEQKPRFQKDDLQGYFARAHQSPPANYTRDYNKAAEFGWIHDDGDQSYITSKGLEVVESGFSGERESSRPGRRRTGARGKKKAAKKARR
jgi:hypothetical protein